MSAEPYCIHEHKHRFSAWAAGRAASVIDCRFSVKQAEAILTIAKLKQLLAGPAQLPGPLKIEDIHRGWRDTLIAAAKSQEKKVTHGVAAKIIYRHLKARFLFCGLHYYSHRQAP